MHQFYTKSITVTFLCLFFCIIFHTSTKAQTDPNYPNILLVIADDVGIDAMNGYHQSARMPTTPVLDSLRQTGITFKNTWATPACATTRGAIMSGKYGIKTGVVSVPGNLSTFHNSIFTELETLTGNTYADAVMGKWHISSPEDYSHPAQHNVDHYEGVFGSGVNDYYNWEKVTNGVVSTETEYVTANLTNSAISWINAQTQPWFLWLAHVAPHTPFHVPPSGTYSVTNTNNNIRKFIAMIENLDYEMGRLFANIPPAVLANTVIIFIGDNGTPKGVIQNYDFEQAKNTLYQGGIHVPMIVSGAGVSRQNEEEQGMVHVADIYATVLDIAGGNLPGGMHNSMSFKNLLSNNAAPTRPFNYSELTSTSYTGWSIRDAQYKLINMHDGTQEFYDLLADSLETTNLINSLTAAQQVIKDALETEGDRIRNNWSCQDLIQNGVEPSIDDCSQAQTCTVSNNISTTNIGCCEIPTITNFYNEIEYNDVRSISTNNYPDHDFCHNGNLIPAPIHYLFQVDATPALAAQPTSILSHNNRPSTYFGVGLNGVLIAPAPATPFIFENPNTGEYNWNWVYEPTNNQGSGANWVGLDCASAHTGGQGYHYHGNMFEYAENIQLGISTTTTAPSDPIQIGWAADGFPILYRFGPDANGNLALLQPSYQLKSGDRPGDGICGPCGPYNGKYTNDYEYIAGAGDLDECNGVARNVTLNTACGVQTFNYFYVVTDDFPQLSRCFSGTPSIAFDNNNRGETCQIALHKQEVTLAAGQSVTVGSNTYTTAGTYADTLATTQACDSIVITKVDMATGVFLSARVLLEGAYQGGGVMSNALAANNLLPSAQPFNRTPWNYTGSETATTIPSTATDWVMVEIRDANDPTAIIDQKACFVDNNGYLMALNGSTGITLNISTGVPYTLVIRSRNHLAIASGSSLTFPQTSPYDFTQSSSSILGGSTQVISTSDGRYAMIAGDTNSDGVISVADLNVYLTEPDTINSYVDSDCNFDQSVTVADYNLYRPHSSVIGMHIVRY